MTRSIVGAKTPYILQFYSNHPDIPISELRLSVLIAFGMGRTTLWKWAKSTPQHIEVALRFAERLAEAENRPVTSILKNI